MLQADANPESNMVLTSSRPRVFRMLHRELLRRTQAAGKPVPEWTDRSGSIAFRTAQIGGRDVVIVTLTGPPHELLSDAELGAILEMTPRQAWVARLLALRRTNPEIAAELNIAETTVRSHTEHIFLRLNVRTRRDVADAMRDRVMDTLYPRPTARRPVQPDSNTAR